MRAVACAADPLQRLDPDFGAAAIALEPDYSARPFDDPALIGHGVPIQRGWAPLPRPALPSVRAARACLLRSRAAEPVRPAPRRRHPSREQLMRMTALSRVQLGQLQVAFQFHEAWYQPDLAAADALALLQGQVAPTCVLRRVTRRRRTAHLSCTRSQPRTCLA